MFLAHAPVGYLLGIVLRPFLPAGTQAGVVPVAIAGALAPDLDLLLWLADPRFHHHQWPTHWPVCWAAGVGLAGFALITRRTRRAGALGLVFALNGFVHQLLDSVVGDLRWLAPWSDAPFSLFVVERVREPWWVNFVLHPTFALELALVALAVFVWHRSNRS